VHGSSCGSISADNIERSLSNELGRQIVPEAPTIASQKTWGST